MSKRSAILLIRDMLEAIEKIRESLKVHSVSEVDNLPFDSYTEIQELYRQGQLNVGCQLNENVVDNFGTGGQRPHDTPEIQQSNRLS